MAGAVAPQNDPFGYMGMVAGDLINRGVASHVMGQMPASDGKGSDLFEQLDSEIRQQVMGMPGTDQQKAEMYNQMLTGRLAGALMNNPQLVVAASPFSPYAKLLASSGGYLSQNGLNKLGYR